MRPVGYVLPQQPIRPLSTTISTPEHLPEPKHVPDLSLAATFSQSIVEPSSKIESLLAGPPMVQQQPISIANSLPALLTSDKTMKLSGTESDESISPTKPLPPGATISVTGVGVAFGAGHIPVAKSVSGVSDLKSSSNQTLQQ